MTRVRSALSILPLVLSSTACSMSFGGDFGITAGGSQDIRLAREVIERGGVPDRSQFTAEGLFSEHDIPISPSEPCTEVLCPRAALAEVSPVDGSGPHVLVQLGFDTNITAFERRDVNLALVVDVSGSMSGTKLDATKQALHTLADQLGERDRVSLVAFDNRSSRKMRSRLMDAEGRSRLHEEIDKLHTGGGTNIEGGLARGYRTMDDYLDGPGGREDRVMLFTDAQPNVGATDPDSFVGQVSAWAEQGIGVSVFGVGLDLGAELADAVGKVRGGNSFYLADGEAIASVFDEEFDMIVSPIAYDLRIDVRPAEPFTFVAAYGTPDAAPSGAVEISLSTVFMSKRDGAMAVLLDGPIEALESGETVVGFSLEHETLDGELVSQTFDAKWFGGDLVVEGSGRADGIGAAKLAVLLDEYLALEAAADDCAGELGGDVLERITAAEQRLDALADLLDDQPLRDEAELMRKLAENVQMGC